MHIKYMLDPEDAARIKLQSEAREAGTAESAPETPAPPSKKHRAEKAKAAAVSKPEPPAESLRETSFDGVYDPAKKAAAIKPRKGASVSYRAPKLIEKPVQEEPAQEEAPSSYFGAPPEEASKAVADATGYAPVPEADSGIEPAQESSDSLGMEAVPRPEYKPEMKSLRERYTAQFRKKDLDTSSSDAFKNPEQTYGMPVTYGVPEAYPEEPAFGDPNEVIPDGHQFTAEQARSFDDFYAMNESEYGFYIGDPDERQSLNPYDQQAQLAENGQEYADGAQGPYLEDQSGYSMGVAQVSYLEAQAGYSIGEAQPYAEDLSGYPEVAQGPYSEAQPDYSSGATAQGPYSEAQPDYSSGATAQGPYSEAQPDYSSGATTQGPYSEAQPDYSSGATAQGPNSEAQPDYSSEKDRSGHPPKEAKEPRADDPSDYSSEEAPASEAVQAAYPPVVGSLQYGEMASAPHDEIVYAPVVGAPQYPRMAHTPVAGKKSESRTHSPEPAYSKEQADLAGEQPYSGEQAYTQEQQVYVQPEEYAPLTLPPYETTDSGSYPQSEYYYVKDGYYHMTFSPEQQERWLPEASPYVEASQERYASQDDDDYDEVYQLLESAPKASSISQAKADLEAAKPRAKKASKEKAAAASAKKSAKAVPKTPEKPIAKVASKPIAKTASKASAKASAKPIAKTAAKPIAKTVAKTDKPIANDSAKRPARKASFANILINILIGAFVAFAFLSVSSSFLSQNGMSFFGIRTFIVLTGSMSPEFNEGSYIITKEKDTKRIEPGEIISFTVDEQTILTHRVTDIETAANGDRLFITQGDANQTPDPNKVSESQILGVKIFSMNGLGKLLLSLRDVKNFVICLVILAVLFIAPDLFHLMFSKDRKEKKDSKAKTP
ncbi:MAG: signal peptidase I [Clostridiales bacterium]|jgi:signal peptidase|nr:signal peptidase I [Clostridiales bacterium]